VGSNGDCGFSGVGADHPGAPGGGAAVSAEAGFDVVVIKSAILS